MFVNSHRNAVLLLRSLKGFIVQKIKNNEFLSIFFQLMSVVAKFANDDEKFSESVRKEMKELLEARANNTWGTESCLPAMPAANEIVKPRSNAIVIEVKIPNAFIPSSVLNWKMKLWIHHSHYVLARPERLEHPQQQRRRWHQQRRHKQQRS